MLTEAEKQKLNADTIRDLEQILNHGWYPQWQTLGVGGWPIFYAHGGADWNKYELESVEMETITIHAKDDKSAIEGFKSLYRLDEMKDPAINEVITVYRKINL